MVYIQIYCAAILRIKIFKAELSIAQCIHLVNTFNIQYTQDQSDGRCNSMHAFTLPTNVEERPYLVDGRSAATATDLYE